MAKSLDERDAFAMQHGDARVAVVASLVLFFLASLLALTSLSVSRQFDRDRQVRGALVASYEYRTALRSLLIDLQDAESGQRGYLLTGKESYLAPYVAAQQRLDGDLRRLRMVGAIANTRAVAQLSQLSRSKRDELADTVTLAERGETARAMTEVQSDRGERYMEDARGVVAAERTRMDTLIDRSGREAERSAHITRQTAEFVGVLVVVTLAAAAALIGQVLIQRRRTIVAQRGANDEITALLRTSVIAERVSSSGHWTLTRARQQTWSAGMFPIFGLDAGGAAPTVDEAIAMYEPADRTRVTAQVQHAFDQEEGFALKAEIIDARGQRKHICLEAEFAPDAGGGRLVGAVHDVTAERTSRMALQASEERYRHLAESSTDMMATMAADSTILFVSPASRRILGYAPEELVGRTTLSITHPEDIPSVLKVFSGLRRAGPGDTTFAYRFRGKHKAGAWIWLEGQPRVDFNEAGEAIRYQDVVREIGSRKAAEDALEISRAIALDSERRYRLLAENATDMIARYGLDGTIAYVSPACRQVLGYTADELIGRSTLSLIHPDDLGRIREQFAAMLLKLPSEAMHTEHRAIRRDGTVVWLEGRPRLMVDEAGEPVEYHDVMRDITSRKALETELREARVAAEAATRSKADFLANMSHELRTPLNSVVGFSGLVATAPELARETRHRAGIVRESSQALLGIVNDILDFSKFENEGVTLAIEAVDLGDTLASAIEIMQPQAAEKGLSLTFAGVSKTGTVLVDPVRIRQVVFNLLGNAIKFTQHGGVTLSLERAAGSAFTISVSDTGIGIPEDRLDRIFERFAQADASTSRRFGGTGLGLAICSAIVRAMGGDIAVASEVGLGSTFSFTINAPAATADAPLRQEAEVPRSPIDGLRVLVADDNLFNQELFEALMRGHGLEMSFASNGREALHAVERGGIDLVLMDMQMPVMDGLHATRAIRGKGFTLPVVALTANVVPSQIDLCLEAGMNDHLAKPYTAEAAAAVIARWGRA